jgi:hypothetical protein
MAHRAQCLYASDKQNVMSQSNEKPIEKDGITFPPFAPKLKLERRPTDKGTGDLAEERSLEKELPPRDERAAAPPAAPKQATTAPFFQRPGSSEPFGGDTALQSGWDQLHRARALFESEQEGLRRDRAGLRQFSEELKIREAKLDAREESIALREQVLTEREAALAAAPATPPPDTTPAPTEESAVARLTKAPFAIARSVLGPKK